MQSEPSLQERRIDVLCIGETMALVVPARPEPVESAEDFRIEAGGAESNLACHLAAAGREVEWFSALGDDPLGRRVRQRISSHGVTTCRVLVDPSASTGLYVKDPGAGVHYYRRGSAASRLGPEALRHIDWNEIGTVHLSGITLALSTSCRDLVHEAMRAAREHGVRVSFDVNHRPALWADHEHAASAIAEAAHEADIVFVGRDEAEALWGARSAGEVRALLPETPHLVVKDADVEATEFSGSDSTVVPAFRVDVVEAVGAGDAFAAGWLDAFLSRSPAAERIERGHRFAARALESTGDVPSRAPHRREDDHDGH